MSLSNQKLNKSRSGKVERAVNILTVMKKILFALTMLVFAVSVLLQARGDDVSIDFIYDNLSGGNWIDVEGYGYGWQPDVATSDPNWRPYSDGYWAYTDYGWTWISYEDFGWATYHYGRWASLADYGWVWFPGSDLEWGPAWVSWRTGGDYIGWAPLPPRGPGVVYEGQPIGVNVDVAYDIGPEYYNFCDVRFIGEPVLRDRIFPAAQNVTYITNTVNVTNIIVQNNVVYNYGPNFNVVNTYSSRPVQRLTIEHEAPTNLSAAVKSGTLTKVQGNKLLVAAPPRLATAAPTMKPPAVKAKVAQPRLEHGWRNVPNRAEVEQRIKTENPKNVPPPTRAAARGGGSVPPGASKAPESPTAGVAASLGPRGKQGRFAPGATAPPSLGVSPSQFERGTGSAGGRPRPEATAMSGEGTERVSPPQPNEGMPGGRARPRMTPPQPPGRRPGEEPGAGQRNSGQVPPQNREGTPERLRFGTPAPMGAAEQGQRGRGPQSGFRQPMAPSTAGGPSDEARAQKERTQGVRAQPPPQRGGVPATVERSQAQEQPEGGKRKPEKGTPPPRPQ
jgi:hypothetical protein